MTDGKKLYEGYVEAREKYYNDLVEILSKKSGLSVKPFTDFGGSEFPEIIFNHMIMFVERLVEDNSYGQIEEIIEKYKKPMEEYSTFQATVNLVSALNQLKSEYGLENIESWVKEVRKIDNQK